jgi:calcineurin-like phosphoesterase
MLDAAGNHSWRQKSPRYMIEEWRTILKPLLLRGFH